MLRKIIMSVFVCGALFLSACNKSDDVKNLSKEEVYFFYQQTCPHCHTAADYIKAKHPNMRIKALDIKMPGNRRLFDKAVKGYKVGTVAGTPLICFGDKYIMGWSDDDAPRLDEYAIDYE